jgi:hypothetical protein
MSRAAFLAYLKETDARFDQNLSLYRVETHALKRLASTSDRAFLAIGLKGIGKTASFLTLQHATDVDFVQSISTETQDAHDPATSKPTLQYVPEIRSELVLQALITVVTAQRRGMRRAIVAVARRLAVVLHRMWVDGSEFRWSKKDSTAVPAVA